MILVLTSSGSHEVLLVPYEPQILCLWPAPLQDTYHFQSVAEVGALVQDLYLVHGAEEMTLVDYAVHGGGCDGDLLPVGHSHWIGN